MEWTTENDYYVYTESEGEPVAKMTTFTCRVKTPDPQTVVSIYWTKDKSDFREDLKATLEPSKTNYVMDSPADGQSGAGVAGFKRREVEMVYKVEVPLDKTWLNRDIFCAATVNIQGSPYKLDDCLYIVATGVFSDLKNTYCTYIFLKNLEKNLSKRQIKHYFCIF